MTRKKSNVKALALAVTCAILAGGYSGLNPVYAAEPVFHEVKYDSVNQDLNYVNSGVTTVIPKITFGDVVLGGNIGGPSNINVGSCFSIYGSDGSINAAGNKFTVSGAGAITATSLSLNGTDVKAAIEAKANQTDVNTNKNDISDLKTNKANKTDVYNKIESEGKFAGKDYEGKVNALESTVGDANGGLVKDVADNKADIAKKADQTALNTANDEINALKEKTTNFDTDGTTLTGMTEVGANKVSATTLEVGGRVINGEKVDGYDAAVKNTAKITYDATDGTTITGNVMVNKDATNQVKITDEGIVVGLNSTVIGSDGVYAGGHTEATAKAVLGADGSIKGAGDAAGKYKFKVTKTGDVFSSSVTANLGGFNHVQINNGLTVGAAVGTAGDRVTIAGGGIVATGDIKGKDITATGALKGASLDVTGDISTNGSVTAKGGLSAANGNFTVEGTTGNTAVGGTLDVTGAATLGSTLDVTGAATLGSTLDVTGAATFGTVAGSQTVINGGDITADGNVTAKGGLSAANNAFKVDGTNGNISTDGTLKSKGDFSVGDSNQFTVDAATGNVVSKGKITSEKAKIGAVEIANDGTITGVKAITTDTLTVINGFITNGNIESKGLKVNGNAEITGTLGVNGAVTGASFNGATITATTFNGATIDATHFNNVTLSGGNVDATAITGTTVTGTTVTDGAGASMNAGTVTGTKITDGVATMTGGNLTGVNSITASGNITSTSGTIQGVTLTDGVATMTGGQVTAQNGLVVDSDNKLTSTGLKADDISATKGQIGNIKIDGATITSNTGTGLTIEGVNINNTALGNVTSIDGVSVGAVTGGNGLQFGGNAVVGATNKPFSSTGYEVDGEGNVTGKSFKVNGSNYLDSTGLTTGKAVIGGVNTLNNQGIDTSGKLHVGGQATFGDSTSGNYTTVNGGKVDITANGGTTTIEGAKITTKTLDVEDIILRNEMKDGTGATINIKGSDGSMSVASGKFAVNKEGQLTNKISGTAGGFSYETKLETSTSGIKANYTNAINGNQNIIDMGASGISIGVSGTTPSVGAGFKAELDAATMGYGTANSIVVNKDTIKSALGTDVTRVMTNNTAEQSIVDKVGAASRSLTAGEIVDAAGGMTITTNHTGTTFSNGTTNTLIYGSAITSTNGAATGVLDGSNLTLTNGANKTELTAGDATFTGAAGEKGGRVTTINGGTITTDTLNVERINLGGEVIDKGAAGVEDNSKLYMDAQGNFRAAEGNFTVKGGTGADKGALHNKVGNTYFDTTETGASMKHNNGTVESNVSVGDNSAMISAGASSIEVKNDGITNNGKTTFKGAVDATVPTTETTINGNTITTGHLITDRLTITGSGAAAGAGTGTIALGGDGSITSNIKDAATGKEATFQTNADGTFTHAKDGANETTNTVNAQGNTNKVTDGTNTSTATQTATSIGGVVTNGTVKMRQELTADGMKVSVDGDPANYTQITNKDVSITDPKNAGKRINLSDLGQLNDLDGELTARSEYTSNPTAVGAINAEAGIRREEVARLDNRIDDVNNRVDKVGAMAAAIASLKSIGYDPQAPSEFSIGLGQYKGETGVAMGFFHYPNKNFMINVSLSTAGGETMGGIGATWRFGHKSPQKLLEEQREAQARKELAAAEKYQAAAKLAKEAQERAEYAAKLARQAQVSADNAKAAADATQAKHFQ